jgi:hypothetical protein
MDGFYYEIEKVDFIPTISRLSREEDLWSLLVVKIKSIGIVLKVLYVLKQLFIILFLNNIFYIILIFPLIQFIKIFMFLIS